MQFVLSHHSPFGPRRPGKVFVHVLLVRLRPLVDRHQRPQQSGFTGGRSTLDAILSLRLLYEVHREIAHPLHGVYVDLKAAFDSLDRNALWKAMQGIGTPQKILDLLRALHSDTSSRVRDEDKMSSPFDTATGVRQGCVLAPKLFCTAIDWIMNNMPAELGITVGDHFFDDLDYADDALLIVDSNERLLSVLKRFEEMAGTVGMHPSWPKTKIQNLGAGPPDGPVTSVVL